MKLLNKQKLYRLQRKSQGNLHLVKAIDRLIDDLESEDWQKPEDLLKRRPDADNVYKSIMSALNDIREIENLERLTSSYEFEKALLLDKKLRLLIKEQPDLKPLRKKLRRLMSEYEERVWSEPHKVSDQQISESERAERTVEAERRFLKKRKEAIRKKLKEHGMNQQDLGFLLGHSESYVSELMNGISPFTMKDLVIIHRVFRIPLNTLIPTYLQTETHDQVNESIRKLNKPELRIKKDDPGRTEE